MALETLKGVKEIHGEQMEELYVGCSPASCYIYVEHDRNTISFKIQDGPIKEKGKNGCQVDHIIAAGKQILEGLNKNFPCRENSVAVLKLDEALMWLNKRTKDREVRGVEGTSKA